MIDNAKREGGQVNIQPPYCDRCGEGMIPDRITTRGFRIRYGECPRCGWSSGRANRKIVELDRVRDMKKLGEPEADDDEFESCSRDGDRGRDDEGMVD